MEKEMAIAGAETSAGSGDGVDESSDAALLAALEAEDTVGRSTETNPELTQGDDQTGSPGSDDAAVEGEEDEGEDGEDGEDDGEEEEVQPGRAQKRISKLVAERNEVRKERDELKSELERLKSGAPQSAGPWDPLAADEEYVQARQGEAKSSEEYRTARGLLRRLDRDSDEVLKVVGKAFKVEDITVDQARDLLEDYADKHQEKLSEAKAKRVAKEAELRQVNQQAAKVWQAEAVADMPWLKNPKDLRQKHRAAILKAHPWVEQIPAGGWLVAAAAAKLAALEARQRGALEGKGKPVDSERRIVPGSGRPTAQSARASGKNSQRMAEASKRHLENPDDEALSEFLDAAVAG